MDMLTDAKVKITGKNGLNLKREPFLINKN